MKAPNFDNVARRWEFVHELRRGDMVASLVKLLARTYARGMRRGKKEGMWELLLYGPAAEEQEIAMVQPPRQRRKAKRGKR